MIYSNIVAVANALVATGMWMWACEFLQLKKKKKTKNIVLSSCGTPSQLPATCLSCLVVYLYYLKHWATEVANPGKKKRQMKSTKIMRIFSFGDCFLLSFYFSFSACFCGLFARHFLFFFFHSLSFLFFLSFSHPQLRAEYKRDKEGP